MFRHLAALNWRSLAPKRQNNRAEYHPTFAFPNRQNAALLTLHRVLLRQHLRLLLALHNAVTGCCK